MLLARGVRAPVAEQGRGSRFGLSVEAVVFWELDDRTGTGRTHPMTTEQALGRPYRAGTSVFDRHGEKVGTLSKQATRDAYLVVEHGWVFPAACVIPLSAIQARDDHGITLKLSKDELQTRLASFERLRPLVEAALQREVEHQRTARAERERQFQKAMERALSAEVRAALGIVYAWDHDHDRPQATFDLWTPTQLRIEHWTLTQQRETNTWSVAVRSGAALVEDVSSEHLQQEVLVAIGQQWKG
jgi:hypothetical protein